jgi:pimeloyl-ACP methyl ester carboxylesterase
MPFYGYNKPDAKVSQGVRDSFWLQGMQASINGVYDCIKAFSETDFSEDLKKIDVPTLILHGDADQIVPIDDASRLSAKLVKNSTLKVYPGRQTACARLMRTRSMPTCSRFLAAPRVPRIPKQTITGVCHGPHRSKNSQERASAETHEGRERRGGH